MRRKSHSGRRFASSATSAKVSSGMRSWLAPYPRRACSSAVNCLRYASSLRSSRSSIVVSAFDRRVSSDVDDVSAGRVLTGENFNNLPDDGPRVEGAARYAAYGADEIHEICMRAGVPMVFDAHHHVVHDKLSSYEDPSVGAMLLKARAAVPADDVDGAFLGVARFGTPADVAGTVAFQASQSSRMSRKRPGWRCARLARSRSSARWSRWRW